MIYRHQPFKNKDMAVRGGKTTLSVGVAVLICNNIPALSQNLEVTVPVVAGILRMIQNYLKHKFGFDIL